MYDTFRKSDWLIRAAMREDRGGRPKVARALRQMAEDARPLEPTPEVRSEGARSNPFAE